MNEEVLNTLRQYAGQNINDCSKNSLDAIGKQKLGKVILARQLLDLSGFEYVKGEDECEICKDDKAYCGHHNIKLIF